MKLHGAPPSMGRYNNSELLIISNLPTNGMANAAHRGKASPLQAYTVSPPSARANYFWLLQSANMAQSI